LLSALYSAVARRRRERYAARPDLRRRLRRPVVSIGNIAVGGRGKTPMAACVARLLADLGERPAILSRGYARTLREDGVVVVSDPRGIRADVARAGDEPLMLARQLPGVPVLVSSNRYLSGMLAEHHFGATVHVLDDGFQHLQLDRDVDLVIVGREDVIDQRTLPAGRLREPIDVLLAADAIITTDAGVEIVPGGVDIPVFHVRRETATAPLEQKTVPSLVLAGIASPSRFTEELRAAGWNLAGELVFPDHHAYSRRDVQRLWRTAETSGARQVVTTEKDLVRLLPFRPFDLPVIALPLTMVPDALPEFRQWLAGALRDARDTLG
jgi:tetraacyldisaccharide 4'-kinase